jgi:hypothetical protein
MMDKLNMKREKVRSIIKDEVENIMRLGADVTGMSYKCKSSNTQRQCLTPRNMRTNFCQDGSELNLKRMHWIFHELPVATHKDVLMQRKSHADLVVAKVEKAMNMRWAPKMEGETAAHKNCIEHIYARILNEKKQTIVKRGDGNKHGRMPYVRNPKTWRLSKYAGTYKKGRTVFYWNSHTESEHVVSLELVLCAL